VQAEPRIPRKYRVFFDGFLLNREEVIKEIEGEGMEVEPDWDDPSLVELLFELRDGDVAEILRGSFNICAYGLCPARVKLLNCRHGVRHLYYRSTPDFFAFATEMKALIPLGSNKGKVNWRAVQDMFNFGYISGTQTFFEDVRLLEQGSVLTVGHDGVKRRKYWDYQYRNDRQDKAFDILVDEGAELLDQAVCRLLDRFGRAGVPLSGGWIRGLFWPSHRVTDSLWRHSTVPGTHKKRRSLESCPGGRGGVGTGTTRSYSILRR